MSLIPSGVSVATAFAEGLLSQVIIRQRSIGGIIADATLSEDHEDEIAITEHPVEQGATISDHAFIRPARVTIRIGFSNSSPRASSGLSNLATAASGILGAFGPITGTLSSALLQPALTLTGIFGDLNYVDNAYAYFLNMQANRNPITVQTGKRLYTDMLIRRLSTHTDYKFENSAILTLELQQVIITTTQMVTVPNTQNASAAAAPGVASTSQSGNQNPMEGPENSSISVVPGSEGYAGPGQGGNISNLNIIGMGTQ